jgi:hypothetical protein
MLFCMPERIHYFPLVSVMREHRVVIESAPAAGGWFESGLEEDKKKQGSFLGSVGILGPLPSRKK